MQGPPGVPSPGSPRSESLHPQTGCEASRVRVPLPGPAPAPGLPVAPAAEVGREALPPARSGVPAAAARRPPPAPTSRARGEGTEPEPEAAATGRRRPRRQAASRVTPGRRAHALRVTRRQPRRVKRRRSRPLRRPDPGNENENEARGDDACARRSRPGGRGRGVA